MIRENDDDHDHVINSFNWFTNKRFLAFRSFRCTNILAELGRKEAPERPEQDTVLAIHVYALESKNRKVDQGRGGNRGCSRSMDRNDNRQRER